LEALLAASEASKTTAVASAVKEAVEATLVGVDQRMTALREKHAQELSAAQAVSNAAIDQAYAAGCATVDQRMAALREKHAQELSAAQDASNAAIDQAYASGMTAGLARTGQEWASRVAASESSAKEAAIALEELKVTYQDKLARYSHNLAQCHTLLLDAARALKESNESAASSEAQVSALLDSLNFANARNLEELQKGVGTPVAPPFSVAKKEKLIDLARAGPNSSVAGDANGIENTTTATTTSGGALKVSMKPAERVTNDELDDVYKNEGGGSTPPNAGVPLEHRTNPSTLAVDGPSIQPRIRSDDPFLNNTSVIVTIQKKPGGEASCAPCCCVV